MAVCLRGYRDCRFMSDQQEAGKGPRKGAAETPQGFDRERVVLAIIGLLGAAFIVAMNFS